MSRQLISRANQVFNGRAALGNYQTGKPGGEVHLLYRFKPVGNRAATFTGVLATGAVSGTLSANWGGASGIFPITFSDGVVLGVIEGRVVRLARGRRLPRGRRRYRERHS